MSSMLEQALIDAKALKESALKNAEAMIIEKYSDQIKEAVDSLLEQEDELPGSPGEEAGEEVLDQVPSALEPDLPGSEEAASDDAAITLDLPALKQAIDNLRDEEGEEAVEDLGDDVPSHEDLANNLEPAVDASPEADMVSDITPATAAPLEEELEITDELIDEILESLKVDIDPQMRGWAGTPQSQMEEYEDMALARENDDEVKEENEALRARVAELEESLKAKNSKSSKLLEENNKFREALLTLKEKIELVNVSNAKLLYINKTLENPSLNERQKKKIVEAISKSETTKEAKVIYETLQSTVGSTEKRSMPKSLSEAVSRSPSLLINAQKNNRKQTTDDFSERLQRLAGIKK